jgi:4'-phosphopantetheinyl transferase
MNISIEIQEFGSTKLYLASYESFDSAEGLEFLTVPEQERFFSFKHEKRRQEFVVTRYLRTQIFGKKHIQYSPVGAPFIENEGFISISHSIHCVGIILNPHFQVA